MKMKKIIGWLFISVLLFHFSSPALANKPGRLVMFVGVDISGSFLRSKYFSNSLDFLAHYLYAHLQGYSGFEVPHSLFVGSIGGARPDEPKTFYPIQTFKYKDLAGIHKELKKIFPQKRQNPNTDYNAFFVQIADVVKNRKLVLRPISIVMLSDGIPDVPKVNGRHNYRSIDFIPLETLARNVTVRLLFTSAVVGNRWRNHIKRDRVKVWTQDAQVMVNWNSKDIFDIKKKFVAQDKFFSWVKDLVDFKARIKRVK